MAPMIDMVFLLLVFFMTVSTLARDERVALELAESERAKVPDGHTGRGTISLKLAEDGSLRLYSGANEIDLEAMKAGIREGIARDPDLQIYVRAAQDVPYRHVRTVLQACAEVGAYKVIYGTYQTQ